MTNCYDLPEDHRDWHHEPLQLPWLSMGGGVQPVEEDPMMTIKNTNAPYLYDQIRRLIPLGGRVLDVGSGYGHYHPQVAERCREMVLVDAFERYLTVEQEKFPTQVKETHWGLVQDVLPRLIERGDYYDIVLCIDFVEHLPREQALRCIEQMKQLGPTLVVFTCRGNHPQDKDWLNEGNDFHQTHKSRWEAGELQALGFEEEIWDAFHSWAFDRYAKVEDFSPDALWAVWRDL